MRSLLLHMGDLLVVLDRDGVMRYVSPSVQRLLGHDDLEITGRSAWDFVHDDDQAAGDRALSSAVGRPGPGEPLVLRLRSASGAWVAFEVLPNNLLDDPEVAGVVVVARDVTERQRGERVLQGQADLLELIAAGADVPIVLAALAAWVEQTLDGIRCSILLLEQGRRHGVLRDSASPSMTAAYRAAIDGMSVEVPFSPCAVAVRREEPVLVPDLLADEQWAPMHALARELGVRSCWSYPVVSPATGATLGTFALYADEVGLPDAPTTALMRRASHLVGITVDRHELVTRLGHQARHEALTGLPNRLMLIETLAGLLASGEAPVVVFLDLDRLKVINDSLGHETGDELLVDMARRLRGAVAPRDLVARFGGDEFVVVLPQDGTRTDVAELMASIREVVSDPIVLEGRVITPGASAGVVVASPGQSATEVLRDADIAMYRAKHRGGGGYALFGEDMRQRAWDRLDLETQIRHGLAVQQFRVHYQPIVDMRRGDRVLGFEALVRWQHPERGLLAPAAFISLAEETGLIVPLGEWVLRAAVATARGWSDKVDTTGLTMSVNLAGQQLHAVGMTAIVQELKDAIIPWTLGLEFTESTLMDDTPLVAALIAELASTGARLSIDDFGTGFSSLSYLTRLPVRRLKIDRSFVADLPHKPEAATVVGAIIGLAAKLGLTVVAEGVETPEQRATLLEMGCRFAQGYLFGRPVPEDDALALLRSR
ncbi:MAG: EAL domain-containing protein [Mycobacteriales bacterium]|nr:EAL domain-containing protein [Mycobacteriales bacterium]